MQRQLRAPANRTTLQPQSPSERPAGGCGWRRRTSCCRRSCATRPARGRSAQAGSESPEGGRAGPGFLASSEGCTEAVEAFWHGQVCNPTPSLPGGTVSTVRHETIAPSILHQGAEGMLLETRTEHEERHCSSSAINPIVKLFFLCPHRCSYSPLSPLECSPRRTHPPIRRLDAAAGSGVCSCLD